TYTFGPTLLNQAVFGTHRNFTDLPSTSAFAYSSIGATVPASDNAYPSIFVPGQFAIPGAPAGAIPFTMVQNTFDVSDTLSDTIGRHFLQIGGGLTRMQNNRVVPFGAVLIFNSFPDFLLGESAGAGGNGGPISNILGSNDYQGAAAQALRIWDGDAFLEDDFRLTSALTLNLGLRYDHIGDMADNLGHNVGFDPSMVTPYSTPPAAGSLAGFVVSSNYPGAVPPGVTQLNNEYGINGIGQNTWNPRLGFAWQPSWLGNSLVLRGGYGVYHSVLTGNPQILSTFGPPFVISRSFFGVQNASASWAQPIPPFTGTLPDFTPYSPSSFLSASLIDPNYQPSLVQEYNLNLQKALTPNLVLEVGYSGSRATHVLDSRSINQACAVGDPIDGCPSALAGTPNTTATIQNRVPYQGFAVNGLSFLQSQGAYWYDALEASLKQRVSHGLEFQVSYTWAKELSLFANTASGKNGNDDGGSPAGDQNHPNYGPDSFIRPQRLVVSYVYQLPTGHFSSGLAKTALGGWQWSGVVTVQSGHFLTLSASNPFNLYGTTTTTASLGPSCSMSQLATSGTVQSKLTNYFNSNCVITPAVSPYASPEPALESGACGTAAACAQATGFGTLGVGVVKGPDQANWDMSLGKHFGAGWINETSNVEFRADFFNTFNHPQFADPNTGLPQPGTPASANTFGYITSTTVNPRVVQLGLVLTF
ncbi:MAG: TonB-dependent receptor domain-containing protein, partial [Terriglobales bacterium]